MRLSDAEALHGRKACALAAFLGVDLHYARVDLACGAHRQPAYLAINPMGQIPTLWDGTEHLSESNAIAIRLATEVGSDIWSAGQDQAQALRWLSWDSEHFKPVVATDFIENVLKPFLGKTPNQMALARADADFPRVATILDNTLEGHEFVLGCRLTIADFSLATFFSGHLSALCRRIKADVR